jgi:hypothetical protein
MNWIFEAFTNVYSTAMMQDMNRGSHAATAKDPAHGKRSSSAGFVGRH